MTPVVNSVSVKNILPSSNEIVTGSLTDKLNARKESLKPNKSVTLLKNDSNRVSLLKNDSSLKKFVSGSTAGTSLSINQKSNPVPKIGASLADLNKYKVADKSIPSMHSSSSSSTIDSKAKLKKHSNSLSSSSLLKQYKQMSNLSNNGSSIVNNNSLIPGPTHKRTNSSISKQSSTTNNGRKF